MWLVNFAPPADCFRCHRAGGTYWIANNTISAMCSSPAAVERKVRYIFLLSRAIFGTTVMHIIVWSWVLTTLLGSSTFTAVSFNYINSCNEIELHFSGHCHEVKCNCKGRIVNSNRQQQLTCRFVTLNYTYHLFKGGCLYCRQIFSFPHIWFFAYRSKLGNAGKHH